MYPHVKVALAVIALLVAAGLFYLTAPQLSKLTILLGQQGKKDVESTAAATRSTSPTDDASASQAPDATNKPAPSNSPPPHFEEKLRFANESLAKDELVNARKIAENLLLDPKLVEFSQSWIAAAELISKINTTLLFSDAPCPEKIAYAVASGDNLIKIANRFNTTVSLIQRSNGLDETNPMIYPKQTFRIYQAQWNIRVSKSRFALLLKDGDRLVKMYKVGIGRQDRTPAGAFVVDLKDFEPDWWRPGEVIKYGDPRNVLGSRWLGLSPIDGTDPSLRGYGIHGTTEPESIGTAASQGCVRMVNEQVDELFDIVPVGTRVVIEE